MKFIKICLCLTLTMLLFGACDNKIGNKPNKKNLPHPSIELDVLSGTWMLDKYTKYFFDGLGSGKLILTADTYVFLYNINEDILSIDFESSSAKDSVYQFEIDKNTLTLNSQNDNKGIFVLTKN